MRNVVAACLAATALAGCGLLGGGRSGSHFTAADAPDWEVCYFAVSARASPSLREYSNNVIRTRPVDCNQHMPMVMARLQQDGANQAQIQQGLQMMQMARPQPAPASPTVTCRTQNMGAYVHTVCN